MSDKEGGDMAKKLDNWQTGILSGIVSGIIILLFTPTAINIMDWFKTMPPTAITFGIYIISLISLIMLGKQHWRKQNE
jgi:hypothetical protein